MHTMHLWLAALLAVAAVPAYAHTTVEVGPYEVEAGWGTEPPIVGIRNTIVLRIIEPGEVEGTFAGITGVFKGVAASIAFGGESKGIDINSDPRPGYYYSPIIPTRTGTYLVELRGEIRGTPVDLKIPVEDVEPTAVLDFPPSSGGGSGDFAALKNAISSLQRDVAEARAGGASSGGPAGGASYDLAVLGLSIASAAIVLAVISMVRRR